MAIVLPWYSTVVTYQEYTVSDGVSPSPKGGPEPAQPASQSATGYDTIIGHCQAVGVASTHAAAVAL